MTTRASWPPNLSSKPLVISNTADEMEASMIESVADKANIVGIGPLLEDTVEGSLFKSDDKNGYMDWLDSITVLKKEQVEEIWKGFRLSERPYLWVVRKDNRWEGQELVEEEDEGVKKGVVVFHDALRVEFDGGEVFVWRADDSGATMVGSVYECVADGKGVGDACEGGDELRRCLEIVLGEGERPKEISKKADMWKEKTRQATVAGGFFVSLDGEKLSSTRLSKDVVAGFSNSKNIDFSFKKSSIKDIVKLAAPFQFTFVGKLVMCHPNFDFILGFFRNLKLSGNFSVGLLDPKHVAIQLSNDLEYSPIFSRRSYYISNSQMRLVKWSPYFDIKEKSPIIEPKRVNSTKTGLEKEGECPQVQLVMEEQLPQPHILVAFYSSQCHINPTLHLSKRLAREAGVRITFSTAVNGHRRMFPNQEAGVLHDDLFAYIPYSNGYDEGFDPKIHDNRTYITLRAPHSCHLKYMENMNSIASLVMAMIQQHQKSKRPWGLVVHRNEAQRFVLFLLRYACEFLMQVIAIHVNKEFELEKWIREKNILRTRTLLGTVNGIENKIKKLTIDSQMNDLKVNGILELQVVTNEIVRLIETAMDIDGLINGWHMNFTELTGLSVDKAIGRHLITLTEDSSVVAVKKIFFFALQGKEEQDAEYRKDNGPIIRRTLAAIVDEQAARGQPVICIIYSFFMSWAAEIARERGIPSFLFWIQPAGSATAFAVYWHYFHDNESILAAKLSDPLSVVNLPRLPPIRIRDLPLHYRKFT
ncbi:hypothetical protein M5K25_004670 [Dendrobium thyrsiflorum]|uniref:Uncharacterized protein n=1 Tax=Dendrobium thyrsiflorum TaxID=117978 RepID=A0ABD0VFG5_DENTH